VATSLISQLMNEFQGDTLHTVASTIGESSARTQSALGGVLPALMGGIDNNASTVDQAAGLLDLIKRNNLDFGTFGDASSAIRAPGGINGLINAGRPLLDSLFGRRAGAVTDWVASLSGINRTSSSSLLSMAAPIVLGAIAKRLKSSGWSASNLMSLLAEQRSFLGGAPAGLAALLKPEVESREYREPVVRAAHYEPIRAYAEARRSITPWLWALPLAFIIPFVGYLLSSGNEGRRVAMDRPAADITQVPVQEPARPVGTTGSVPAAATPKEFGPFTLEFQTGTSSLTAASVARLHEVVDVLEANPNAHADINGFTDSTGSDAANRRLSEARATAAAGKIAGLGIDKSRLTAQGFGAENPVADNDSADGRQRNRRVEIRVMDKS
jgi:OmpA-OmpF porin, OOP family